MVPYENVVADIVDEGAILYTVEKSPSGSLTAVFRVYGHVSIDGVEYECDRDTVRVALKKVK